MPCQKPCEGGPARNHENGKLPEGPLRTKESSNADPAERARQVELRRQTVGAVKHWSPTQMFVSLSLARQSCPSAEGHGNEEPGRGRGNHIRSTALSRPQAWRRKDAPHRHARTLAAERNTTSRIWRCSESQARRTSRTYSRRKRNQRCSRSTWQN